MSEYTTREILGMIEANGGPGGLDLSGRDLSEIDLSSETVEKELDMLRERRPGAGPHWWAGDVRAINLRYTNFRRANLRGANLESADLRGANLEDALLVTASLRRSFLMNANLRRSVLIGARLEKAALMNASLRQAEMRGADLEGAILYGADLTRVSLLDVRNVEGVYLWGAVLERTQLSKGQLSGGIGEELDGHWFRAKEAYLALKNNFEQIGRYGDASWAYRKERRMEKREAWQKANEAFQEGRGRDFASKTWKAGCDLIVECLCDYGEGVGRVLGWMGFLLFVAGPLIFGLPGLLGWPGEIREAFFSRRQPWRYGYAYLQQFLYVLDAFTTASFAELQPATALTRLLSGLTALIGVFLTGLLGFAAGNRIRRS